MAKLTVSSTRRLITGNADPLEAYPVPDTTGEFSPAPDIEEIATALKARHFQDWPEDLQVDYLWKARGGAVSGRPTLGKTIKAGGLNGYYSGADFIIWVAADHVDADPPMSRLQVEALVYHEMLHVIAEENTKDIRAHDVEAFREEIEFYGFWATDLLAFGRTMQRALPGFNERDEIPELPPVFRSKEDVTVTVEAAQGMPILTPEERGQ